MSLRVALVGNPNCGKTTLFNALTGSTQYVGNWPGVTVEKKEGRVRRVDQEVTVIDLPGIYSLSPYTLEERIARDFLLQERPDVVINIVDGTNLERNLYLTMQLLEMGLPMVLALNMMDEVTARGDEIHVERLSSFLGVPVVPMVAARRQGIDELLQAVIKRSSGGPQPVAKFRPADEQWVARAEAAVAASNQTSGLPERWAAIKLLEGDADIISLLGPVADVVAGIRAQWVDSTGQDSESLLADARYQVIADGVGTAVHRKPGAGGPTISDRIDRVLTNRVLAIPIFLLIMWSMFQVTFGRLGSWTIDTIDVLWNGTLHDWVVQTLTDAGAAGWLVSLIGDGIIGGLGSMLVFVGQIMILFFLLALLEDSGYMARVAFIMDRMLRRMGLSGKAFIPMLLGFGCNVPAIMATRTLETEQDRRLSIMINPFMSCSARLPIYALFAGSFFAAHRGMVVFSLYLLGMLVAILAGILLRKTVLKGEAAPLVLELPPYRWPTLRGLSLHMWDRGKEFVKKAGTVIFAAAVFIWFLQAYTPALQPVGQLLVGTAGNGQPVSVTLPADAEWGSDVVNLAVEQHDLTVEEVVDEETGEAAVASPVLVPDIGGSLLGKAGRFIAPVFQPLGFSNPDDPVNGWKPAAATLTGVVAKEVVVATLGQLYGVGAEEDESSTALADSLHDSFTPLSAYSFMVFCLLYLPCIAALGVIKREMNSWRWTLGTMAFSLGVAYFVSLLVYQVGSLLGLA